MMLVIFLDVGRLEIFVGRRLRPEGANTPDYFFFYALARHVLQPADRLGHRIRARVIIAHQRVPSIFHVFGGISCVSIGDWGSLVGTLDTPTC